MSDIKDRGNKMEKWIAEAYDLFALVNEEDVRSLDETLLDKLCCHFPECWTKKKSIG